jgi:hypothetical protein
MSARRIATARHAVVGFGAFRSLDVRIALDYSRRDPNGRYQDTAPAFGVLKGYRWFESMLPYVEPYRSLR